jgi:hypothetical protein
MGRKLDTETQETVDLVERWFGNEPASSEHYDEFVENMTDLRRAEEGEWEIPTKSEFGFAVDYLNGNE